MIDLNKPITGNDLADTIDAIVAQRLLTAEGLTMVVNVMNENVALEAKLKGAEALEGRLREEIARLHEKNEDLTDRVMVLESKAQSVTDREANLRKLEAQKNTAEASAAAYREMLTLLKSRT